jgi:hypothetical protein
MDFEAREIEHLLKHIERLLEQILERLPPKPTPPQYFPSIAITVTPGT